MSSSATEPGVAWHVPDSEAADLSRLAHNTHTLTHTHTLALKLATAAWLGPGQLGAPRTRRQLYRIHRVPSPDVMSP